MSPRIKATYDRIIADMAGHLLLDPVVDPADDAACEARWRLWKMPPIAIQEFGGEAKALAQTDLHKLAGGAGQSVSPLAAASMIERHDGVRVSGEREGGRDAA